MQNFGKHLGHTPAKVTLTPQSRPIRGMESQMVDNQAGGFSFKSTNWTNLNRFLVLGTEGGSFYLGEKAMTVKNVKSLDACLAENGLAVVDQIMDVSLSGRARKQDSALFALAMAASYDHQIKEPTKPVTVLRGSKAVRDQYKLALDAYESDRAKYDSALAVRKAALAALPKVARTATALFMFLSYLQGIRKGWSRSLRSAVAAWYTGKNPAKLAYQAVKYKSREGWSHRDVLRLTHPFTSDPAMKMLFSYMTDPKESILSKGLYGLIEATPKSKSQLRRLSVADREKVIPFTQKDLEVPFANMESGIKGVVQVAAAEELLHIEGAGKESVEHAVRLIRDFNLPREVVPTALQKDPKIWEALVEDMPMTAMIRTLNRMTACGLLTERSDSTKRVLANLRDVESLQNARVHPMSILMANRQYMTGHGDKGSLTWTPVQRIVDAMDEAFYLAFKAVEPTAKDILVAVDCSGSMTYGATGGLTNLTPAEAAAAMALVIVATEPSSELIGYDNVLRDLRISPKMRLADAVKEVQKNGGGTDTSLPFVYALKAKERFDAIVSFTDNCTWAGYGHPFERLVELRKKRGPVLAVNCTMTSNGVQSFPEGQEGVLEVAGLDGSLPTLINEFIKGNV